MVVLVNLEARWGRQRLPFSLQRADVKRLRIVVDPEGNIFVTAPAHASDEDVIARVARRGDWIQRQQERFSRWRPRTPVRQYLNGETYLFLGKQLRLQIQPGTPERIDLSGNSLLVTIEGAVTRARVRDLVQQWYATQSRTILRRKCTEQSRILARHGVNSPKLIVRILKNRWGSLTAAGNLVLNADLVRASPPLIDYVIAHELAHSVYPDHSIQWRALLSRMMPDWEERKAQLESQLL